VKKFNKLSGAHKADLWRYCILYKNGGIYLDIKTILVKPLKSIFTQNYFYTVISYSKNHLHQGIIATPPGNPILFKAIMNILHTPINDILSNYHIFTQYLYKIIMKQQASRIYLFQEQCIKGNDKYGFYCTIKDGDEIIFKTRFSDFPWI